MGWMIAIVASGLGALGVLYQAVGSARDRRANVAPGELGLAGGHRLHYRCAGAGTPAVVLDAGIAASSLTWSRVQPIIGRFTRVCSYDRAGLAWSEAASSPRTMPALVSELRYLLESAQVPPPYVLVGHSFGGLVIRAFARAHPKDVAGLVFVDPLHPEEWCDPSPQQRQMLRGAIFLSKVGGLFARLGVVRVCLSLLSGGSPGIPRQFSRLLGRKATALIERMVGEVQKLPPDVLPAIQAHWSHPKAFRGMWQHLASMPECCAAVARGADAFGDMPVVVLSAGARSARWQEADARLAHGSSTGRHTISSRSGHWVHLDDPDLVVQAVDEVIRRYREAYSNGPTAMY
jgi:pimeloyl-ACP methyl ester carboxylesterase